MSENLSTREKERSQLRRQMAIQHQIERLMNTLIRSVKQLVDDTQIAESNMEKHQLKNLLNVALESPSVEVVKHYILYQMGRDTAGTSWRYRQFGERLIKHLDELGKTETELVLGAISAEGKPAGSAPYFTEKDEIWHQLVRAYLGQLNRYFYYAKEKSRWPQETSG
ncbi:MAG: hypothetical protein D6784_17615 [Chloroflexi bacterium]|nr:MAG: hypothetical protein D6784_17615 [Chloroflexota bacterium]